MSVFGKCAEGSADPLWHPWLSEDGKTGLRETITTVYTRNMQQHVMAGARG